ncbi:MAG: hypothetical protein KAT46_07280 [Deltaproteobacteria bacterium]|nr:hypothetical protein [Deltaproteobacteria bacterium]
MERRVLYQTEEEKNIAISDNAGLRLLKDERHISGKDADGGDIFEQALIFTDTPHKLSVLEQLDFLENENAELKIRVQALENGL